MRGLRYGYVLWIMTLDNVVVVSARLMVAGQIAVMMIVTDIIDGYRWL